MNSSNRHHWRLMARAAVGALIISTLYSNCAPSGFEVQTGSQDLSSQGPQGGDSGPGPTPLPTPTPVPGGPPAVAIPWVSASASALAPKVFNFPSSSKAGDVVSLQGENLSGAEVWLQGTSAGLDRKLSQVNAFGAQMLTVLIPSDVKGAIVLEVRNASGTSGSLQLNVAKAFHLDALQLVPGGAFRIFGRSLIQAGFTPTVKVDGLEAQINTNASEEHMLVVTAPMGLTPKSNVAITVDNGNGTSVTQLDLATSVVAGSGDPFELGVGWGGVFTFANNVIAANVVAGSTADQGPAIRTAIQKAQSMGGGVVTLPAGQIRLATSLEIPSSVVVKGAGKNVTYVNFEVGNPFYINAGDRAGLMDMNLVNTGASPYGFNINNAKRVFVKNVYFVIYKQEHLFWANNQNFVVMGCVFDQTYNYRGFGPFYLGNSNGMVFANNRINLKAGAPGYMNIHEVYMYGNETYRDASNQNITDQSDTVVHLTAFDFAYNMAMIGNTFATVNGPVTNLARGDGESILTESGGGARIENIGTVGSATATSITDNNNTINTQGLLNYGIAIVAGKGAGQHRRIANVSGKVVTVDKPWVVVPDTTSKYATFGFAFERTLIKRNIVRDNSRGILVYQSSSRDLDIVDNKLTNTGGIYLRAYQQTAEKLFNFMANVRIEGNVVESINSKNPSHIGVMAYGPEQFNYGMSYVGVEVRSNKITANTPNFTTNYAEFVGKEAFMNQMYQDSAPSSLQKNSLPRSIGTVFQNNTCENCDVGFLVSNNIAGTTLYKNIPSNNKSLYQDVATASSTGEKSLSTVVVQP